MTKEIEIQGCVSVPEEVSMDDLLIISLHLLKKADGVWRRLSYHHRWILHQ